MTLPEIARAVGGTAVDDPGVLVTGVVADSHLASPGDLFVAIPGERVDGHEFIPAALAAGAVAALTTRRNGRAAVIVDNPVAALGSLARSMLARIPGIRVVAVTGSSGKTTAKDLIAGALAPVGPVVAPQGSFNTEVGVPLTVLRCDDATRLLVLEMGARGPGHIRYLCTLAPPDVGVVLNVGTAHLGEFGSRAAIATAKGELPQALPKDGTAVLNADDPFVSTMPTEARVLTFGHARAADVRIERLELDDLVRPSFDVRTPAGIGHVRMRVPGEHNASNGAAAIAAALAVGMDLQEACRTLSETSVASRWRMELSASPSGVTVINDAYNANPDSVAAALKALVELGRRRGGRTWAVLGEMRELGRDSLSAHDEIGRLAVRLHVQRLVAVGEGARPVHMGAAHEGSWNGESIWVEDPDAAIAIVKQEVLPGDIVLVKASRTIGLEAVAAALLSESGP